MASCVVPQQPSVCPTAQLCRPEEPPCSGTACLYEADSSPGLKERLVFLFHIWKLKQRGGILPRLPRNLFQQEKVP